MLLARKQPCLLQGLAELTTACVAAGSSARALQKRALKTSFVASKRYELVFHLCSKSSKTHQTNVSQRACGSTSPRVLHKTSAALLMEIGRRLLQELEAARLCALPRNHERLRCVFKALARGLEIPCVREVAAPWPHWLGLPPKGRLGSMQVPNQYTSHVRKRPGSADLMRGSLQLLRALVVGQVKVAVNLVRLAQRDNRVLDSEDTRKGWLAILIANLAEKVIF